MNDSKIEAAPEVQPVRARSGTAVVAASVALVAAGVSIAGPSLRPYLADQLTARFGPHPIIGILTGTAEPKPKDSVQIDLAAFDQRMAVLAQALAGREEPSPDAAALVKALGQPMPERVPSPEARKLSELEERFAALGARLDTLDQRLGEHATGAAKGRSDMEARLAGVEQAGAAQTQRTDGLDQSVAAIRQEGEDRAAALSERISGLDRRVAEFDERSAALTVRSGAAAMLTLVSRVRLAMEMSEPFVEDVSALAALVGGDADARAAVAALGAVAARGVANLPRLQRTLTPLLANLVEAEKAAAAPWYTRASSLILWSQPASPRADALGEKVAAITRDLRAGQLSGALWKLRALDAPMGEGMQAWIADANRRLAADQALRTLTELAFRRTQG